MLLHLLLILTLVGNRIMRIFKENFCLFVCDDVSNPPWFLGPLELSAGLGGGSGGPDTRLRLRQAELAGLGLGPGT